jgi:hypothetical protein
VAVHTLAGQVWIRLVVATYVCIPPCTEKQKKCTPFVASIDRLGSTLNIHHVACGIRGDQLNNYYTKSTLHIPYTYVRVLHRNIRMHAGTWLIKSIKAGHSVSIIIEIVS